MRVFASTTLPLPPEVVWREVQKPSLLQHVAFPMAVIKEAGAPHEPFPEAWQEARTDYCRAYLFGFLPAGTRRLHFERVDPVRREIQTRESDPLVRRWDHLLRVEPDGAGTRYSDEIEIDAGPLTPLVWAWASLFYRYRQYRWRRLAKTLLP